MKTILTSAVMATTLVGGLAVESQAQKRAMTIDDVMAAIENGTLKEAFACGTAAVISPIGELHYKGKSAIINGFENGELTEKLYRHLTDIQWGRIADPYGWIKKV